MKRGARVTRKEREEEKENLGNEDVREVSDHWDVVCKHRNRTE